MRVLVLMAIGSPWSRLIVERLSEEGIDCVVVDFEDQRSGRIQPTFEEVREFTARFPVRRLKSRGGRLRYLTAVPELRRLLQTAEVDLVLSLYSAGFGLLASLSKLPHVAYLAGSDILLGGSFKRALLRRILHRAVKVIANGEHVARTAQTVAPQADISSLIHGIRADAFYPCSTPEVRGLRMICTRAFEEIYDNEVIVRALGLLPTGVSLDAIFVGEGTLRPTVERLANEILDGGSIRVSFAGAVPHSSMRDLLCGSDIYVSMARSDGTATSTLEALSVGIYPVLADIPQNREWIIDESIGLLVPPGNSSMLAQALYRLVSGGIDLRRGGERRRNLVVTRGDIGKNGAALAERLRQVATRSVRIHQL